MLQRSSCLEAIALRLEAIATRLEAIAIRLEAIASRLEAIAIRLEAIATSIRFLKVIFLKHFDGAWELSQTPQPPSCANILTHAGP